MMDVPGGCEDLRGELLFNPGGTNYMECVEYKGLLADGDATRTLWLWRCSKCGKERISTRKSLLSMPDPCDCCHTAGDTKKPEYGYLEKNIKPAYYRLRARHRKLGGSNEDCLTFEQWLAKTSHGARCYYCGCAPEHLVRSTTHPDEKIGYILGIDRLDSDGTYTDDNTVGCCWDCNRAKGTMSEEDYLNHVRDIFYHSVALRVV